MLAGALSALGPQLPTQKAAATKGIIDDRGLAKQQQTHNDINTRIETTDTKTNS